MSTVTRSIGHEPGDSDPTVQPTLPGGCFHLLRVDGGEDQYA
jgi:hypothetical protein